MLMRIPGLFKTIGSKILNMSGRNISCREKNRRDCREEVVWGVRIGPGWVWAVAG
jgi:hypothetical protein